MDSKKIKIIVLLKLNQLQREELPTLTYQNLIDYIFKKRWKNALPDSLNDMTTDIFNIQASDIVSFLSYQAIVNSSKNLDDYTDLI